MAAAPFLEQTPFLEQAVGLLLEVAVAPFLEHAAVVAPRPNLVAAEAASLAFRGPHCCYVRAVMKVEP